MVVTPTGPAPRNEPAAARPDGAARPAHEQFTGERRAQAEQYFISQNLLPSNYSEQTQEERDAAFNRAHDQYASNNQLRGGQATNFLMALLQMLFGMGGNEDWQSPESAGLPGGGRFNTMGERTAAMRGAAVAGTVQPVEIEAGTRSAGDLVVELARQELGVRERGGANRGADIARIGAAAGIGEGQPWCASFVSYIYARAGIDARGSGDGVGGTPLALNFEAQFSSRNAYHSFRGGSGGSRTPQTGDVVVFNRGAPGSGQGHVGIVESVEGDRVTLIEGNSGDAVRRNTYSLAALRQGAQGARGFGSIDEATRNNQRFARRGEERAPVAGAEPVITPPPQTPRVADPQQPVQGGSLSRS